jgi:XTP/dITP diphosphohydrolase
VGGLKVRLGFGNENKRRELEQLLPGWRIELLGVDEFPPEEGTTYYDNARAKALFARSVGDPAAWMLGEDSGIEVAGLGGGPGVQSSRSAGGDEVGWLLQELEGVKAEGRRARYVCELVCLSPEGAEFRGTGTLSGRIATLPRCDEGFGFDPIFVPDGEERTVAELGDAWKAQHSHRARAARALLDAVGERDGARPS